MSSPRLPPKKEVLTKLLEQWSVMLYLDPRPAEVRVPMGFKKQPQLALQIGLNLPVPIRDLQIDDDGVSCTLSFNRSPHFCFVPWAAVFAIVGEDSRGMVWPESVPSEITLAQQTSGGAQTTGPKPASGPQQPGSSAQANGARQPRSPSQAKKGGARAAAALGSPKRAALKAVPGGAAESVAPIAAAPVAAAAATAPAPVGDLPAEPAAQPTQKAPRPSYLRVVK